MLHAMSLGIALFALWVILSGHLDPFLLTLGLLSSAVIVFIAMRMDVIDHESHPIHLTFRIPAYWLWLAWEIVKANIEVAKIVLNPALPISPTVAKLRTSQHSELGQVIYANSITLTPGTVSLNLEDGYIEIHALTRSMADSLETGEMDRRVTRMEGLA